jgi:hypothetical protein
VKPKASTLPSSKQQAPKSHYKKPPSRPNFRQKDPNYQASPLELHWDTKTKQAAAASKRRGWDRDKAAEAGGWGQQEYKEPDRGDGWQTQSETQIPALIVARPGEEYIPPHLRPVQPVKAIQSPPTAKVDVQSKYGGLQQNFISAGIPPHGHLPGAKIVAAAEHSMSSEQSQNTTTARAVANGRPSDIAKYGRNKYSTSPPKKDHVDAW